MPTLASAQSAGEKGFAVGCCIFSGKTPAQVGAILDDMKSMGSVWVRIDVSWADVQPTNSSPYDWSALDPVVQAILSRNMKPDLGILETPAWARTTTSYWDPPANPNAYGTFAGQVARHFGAMGAHYFEIWNEPNISGFWPVGPNAHVYGQMLKAAYTNIKANDSNAFVITAGLSPAGTDGTNISPTDFISTLYADGLEPYFDAVGMHPYSGPALPGEYFDWNAWSQMSQTPVNMRSIMTTNGDSAKKIWMTEYGAPTNGLASNDAVVSESRQAQMITDAYTLAKTYSWAGPLMIYLYQDDNDGSDLGFVAHFYGLLRYDGSHKPAYDAFKSISGGTSVTSPPQTGPCTQAYDSTVAVPSGYGAAYNLFSTGKELTVQADCTPATPVLNAGSGAATQYIYKQAYAYKGGSWQQVNLTGSGALIGSNWYAGSAQGALPFTATDLSSNWNYIVSYICNWTGTAWKCGCADAVCASSNWQLQAIKR